ncbi:MAG: hypothetical protein CMP61_03860 [Flavobacteriales bacterium]|nr:hypothetical protein [Flavobacteriales bacterium]|tara:strand:- start:4996 stop:5223 length:228 start_codon:yes stop_codon:yes gene_type:complete
MEDKIKMEKGFIETTENLVLELLKKHYSSPHCKIDAFTKEKMKGLIKRAIFQEVEYLSEYPENYFGVHGQDHLQN